MNQYEKGLVNLIELGYKEEIPAELLKDDGSVSFVLHNNNLFRLQNNKLWSFMNTFKPKKGTIAEFINKVIGEPSYKSDYAYLLEDRAEQHPLPLEILRYSMKYFRDVYDKHGTEAAVLLMFNDTTNEWRLLKVLQMDCTGGGVHYLTPKPSAENITEDKIYYETVFADEAATALMLKSYEEYNALMNSGFKIMGTIHSHCNFGAFHSGTDDADEKDFDGLHITVGNCRSGWSFSARYMINGFEFKRDIAQIVKASLEEITANVDNIVVDPYHMDLIIPELRPSRSNVIQLHDDSSDKIVKWPHFSESRRYDWDPDKDQKEVDEFDVLEEDDYVRIYDILDDKVLLIHQDFIDANPNAYSSSNYRTLKPNEIPKGYRDLHLLKKKQREMDEKKELTLDSSEIVILDDPEINPNYSQTNISTDFQETVAIQKSDVHVKANKKENDDTEV